MTLTNPHTKESIRIHITNDGVLLFDLRYHFSGLYLTRENIRFLQENKEWVEERYAESGLH
jgi:hypothetical protein